MAVSRLAVLFVVICFLLLDGDKTKRQRPLPVFWHIDSHSLNRRSRGCFGVLACMILVLLAKTQLVEGQLAGSSATPSGAVQLSGLIAWYR